MTIIVFLISILILFITVIFSYNRWIPKSVAWFLCFIGVFGMVVLTPLFLSDELEREEEANHAKHSELMDPTFDYCPYCGVELE